MSITCQKDFNIAVAGSPPSLPPFLYVQEDIGCTLGVTDWNRTLALQLGGYYYCASPGPIILNPLDPLYPGLWALTLMPDGPAYWEFYNKPLGSPIGAYPLITWNLFPAFCFPIPTITLLTTSPISISTASPLPDAASMTPYSQFVVAFGAVSTPSYAIIGGALPAGLGINGGTGEISGSPIALGVFNFTIRATDTVGYVDKAFQLTVNSGIIITTATPLPKGIINQPYSRFVTATNNFGAVTWTYHASAGPTGTVLDPGTGEIHGTPTFAATFTFTIRATDSLGFVDKVFNLTMLAAIPAQVQITGTLTVPTGFTCQFGGGVTLDVGTMQVPLNVTLNQLSASHYDDGTNQFTMDLVGGLWAITSIGGIYSGFPLGVGPFAPFPVNLQNGGDCAGASQGVFDVDDNPGIANLVGFHAILHLISYSDLSLPTPLQTDNYASGTLDVQAV